MNTTDTGTSPVTLNNSSLTLLTLSLPPRQADAITDWLLEQGLPGFSSWTGWGHSNRIGHLSISEQIQGKQNRTFVSLHLSDSQCREVIENLHLAFSGFDIHYWVEALRASGSLNSQ
tara:strand:- start:5782 stop:6132 length:351 start_codon:yes stop_codon:yes gene_type:complete